MSKRRLINSKYFSDNLARLMSHKGLNNSKLGFLIGATRQAVHRWRQGTNSPTEENLANLCVALECTPAALLNRPSGRQPRMMIINDWARREQIPVSRARDLFALRILVGEMHTDYTILVPERLRAPEDSGKLVTMAKVRPRWVPTFHENFSRMMRDRGLTESTMSKIIGVKPMAVRHWLYGRNYPMRERLPQIAEALNTSVQELAGHI